MQMCLREDQAINGKRCGWLIANLAGFTNLYVTCKNQPCAALSPSLKTWFRHSAGRKGGETLKRLELLFRKPDDSRQKVSVPYERVKRRGCAELDCKEALL